MADVVCEDKISLDVIRLRRRDSFGYVWGGLL